MCIYYTKQDVELHLEIPGYGHSGLNIFGLFSSHNTWTQASHSLVTLWSQNFGGVASLFSGRLRSLHVRGAVALPRGSEWAPRTTVCGRGRHPQHAASTHRLCWSRTLRPRPPTLRLRGPILPPSSMSDTRQRCLDCLPAPPVITADNAAPATDAAISSMQLHLKKANVREKCKVCSHAWKLAFLKIRNIHWNQMLRKKYLRLCKMSIGITISSISYIHETKLNCSKNMMLFREIHFNKSHKNCQCLAPRIYK